MTNFHWKSRSDVHFWKHGRVGDSMVVTDEVSPIHPCGMTVLECEDSVDLAMNRPERLSR